MRKLKWYGWLLFTLVLIDAMLFVMYWYSRIFRALDYKECDQRINATQPIPAMNREEIIEAVNKLTGTKYKITWEKNVDYYGKTIVVPFYNRVFLNETQSDNNLVWNYTHEVLHVKLFSANERFIQFETFKVLYESGNQYFQDIALWKTSIMCEDNKEYDCTYYVLQYLKD